MKEDDARLVQRWGFDRELADSSPARCLPATPKQLALIKRLAEKKPGIAEQMEMIINAHRESSYVALECCTRAEAHFIITCLNGSRKPVRGMDVYILPLGKWEPEVAP